VFLSVATRIRHSTLGRAVRFFGHVAFTVRHRRSASVSYALPGGRIVHLRPKGDVAEFLFYAPFFEREQLRLVAALLRPGMRVADVGANSGLYSILAGGLVGPNGHVWAMEPSTETFSLLLENIALNGPLPVTPLGVAVSDAEESMRLVAERGFGDAYRFLVPAATEFEGEVVRTVTLDSLQAKHDLAPLDFLKLDIEGGEYRALRGGQVVLEASDRLVVMFESDPQWCARAGCRREDSFELLRSLGFGVYAWGGHSRGWCSEPRDLLRRDMLWAARDKGLLPAR
jgi:FkbM family methyltransferase